MPRVAIPYQLVNSVPIITDYILVMNVKLRLLAAKEIFQMEQDGQILFYSSDQTVRTSTVLPQSTEKQASTNLSQRYHKTPNTSREREEIQKSESEHSLTAGESRENEEAQAQGGPARGRLNELLAGHLVFQMKAGSSLKNGQDSASYRTGVPQGLPEYCSLLHVTRSCYSVHHFFHSLYISQISMYSVSIRTVFIDSKIYVFLTF